MCPNCGYEYEAWVEICPDCGVLIETVEERRRLEGVRAALDEFGPDDDPHWTVVSNVPNAIIGSLLKSQLEDAGIPVFMRRAQSADIAQFSGNDFVPQDLLVPESREDEARRLLDSTPDTGVGAPYWGSGYGGSDSYDAWDEEVDESRERELEDLRGLWHASPEHPEESQGLAGLPEGWTLLPTERDVRARAHHQRTHGEGEPGPGAGDRGSGIRGQGLGGGEQGEAYTVDSSQWQSRSGYEYERPSLPKLQRVERSDYDEEGWSGSPRWVRIFYGILLLAISLPFLFQLLEQLFSFFPW
jgi:Putative prokaryotic signal transducing protein